MNHTSSTVTHLLRQVMGLHDPPYLREIIYTLRQTPAFEHVPRRYLRIIARALYPRAYKPGEIIYLEGDPGLGMYILQSGMVQLSIGEGDEQEEIGCVEAPEIIGYHSLFGPYRRLETARALTETRVLGLFRPDLRDLIRYYPRAAAPLLFHLGALLAGLNEAMIAQVSSMKGKVQALQWAYANLCRKFEIRE